MNGYLQLVSLAYNVEHGMIPAAVPELRQLMGTNPLEEALLQCICVLGIQAGILIIWKVEFSRLYLAISLCVIGLTNFGTAACCTGRVARAHALGFLYVMRLLSGLAASYPVHAIPKYINKTAKAHHTISAQASVQLCGVVGTVIGYVIITIAPEFIKPALPASFCLAGSIALFVMLLCAKRPANDNAPIAVEKVDPSDEHWYDLAALMTPSRLRSHRHHKTLLNRFEFASITCAVGINNTACQALAFWILTVYISLLKVDRVRALTGLSSIFGLGSTAGLALSGIITQAGEDETYEGSWVLCSRLKWMTIFCLITSLAGIGGFLYGDRGFWPLTITMTISVLSGAASLPLAQSALGHCAKQFEDVAYGIFQTVFQSSWFFGPLLPVFVGWVFSGRAEDFGLKVVMTVPTIAFLSSLAAFCECKYRRPVGVEEQIELSWDPLLTPGLA